MSAPVPTLRRGSSLRRVVAALAAVVGLTLVAGSGVAPAAAAPISASASARPSAAPAATESTISATLGTDNAGLVSPGQNLTASVSINNPTDIAHGPGSVDLWFEPDPQGSRNDLTSWLGSTDPVSGETKLGTATVPVLEPGTTTVVRVQVPAAALPFATRTTTAVFGLGATVTAGSATAEARSSFVWSPGGAATRSEVTVAMPIVSPSTADGLLSAQDLNTYTAPNGVLTRDLDGLEGHSTVAVGIDPMIIASIRALGNAAPDSAVEWLDRLAALPNDTFSLGYGDADVAGQLQSGLTAPLTPTSLTYALDPADFSPTPTSIGEPATSTPTPTATGPTPSPTPTSGPSLPSTENLLAWDYSLQGIAWPGDKTLRTADIPPLASAGLRTLVVSGDNSNAAELDGTPNAALSASGAQLAIADQRLSDALRQAVSAPSDVAWNTAMGRLNAQLALISQEGGDARRLLVALDRSWPSSGTQLSRTLDALFSSQWATPSTFRETVSAAQTGGLALQDAPESQARLDSIRGLLSDEQSLDQFATVLDNPETMTGRVRAELLTLLAVSWQNPRSDWTTTVADTRANTVKTLHSIRILPTENVNLVSAQGSIPFTVSNELDGEAATVVLMASPSNGRLEIDGDTTKRILPDSRTNLLVPVKAKVGNGQVVLSLRLYSPTGVPIGDPSSVTVDVHADWEGIGALILGALLVLLFGFGIVRNIVQRRRQRRQKGQEGQEAAEPADSAPTAEAPDDGGKRG
ncbi:DUF6049 family protein [Leifsonia sp. F6_8S_P_1B]|uniref:DUF6049 family protein n=1 Tax=Leifsonia williamsii TaxID=3035919 RepID=A0ABT8K7P7_9MICO|nr:DUF6049 family protein [Leifsonia williamsii]MDN4613473.1 DUF6049 family protein [Leifsonia williamsii]